MNRARIRVIVERDGTVVVDPAEVRQAGFTPGQSLDVIASGELWELSRRAALAAMRPIGLVERAVIELRFWLGRPR